ncbi:MAG: phospholipid carrier-dependent glycosyltransferase [bacterium]|nr:phospholipid carrier-dependent glycosyltransferase [bacterium]
MNANSQRSYTPLLVFAVLAAGGVVVRLTFLMLAGELKPQADESLYTYHAVFLHRFGFYAGGGKALWPPGYSFFLHLFLRLFGADGVWVAKLCQVLLSGAIGFVVMLLARRLFSLRAGYLAGSLWAVHLTFIGFSHYLWSETLFQALFLPAVYLLLSWSIDAEGGEGGQGRLLAAGLLFGLAMLIKEAALFLVPLLAVLILWRRRKSSWIEGVSQATLLALAALVVILPWSLRNWEVYGRVAPVGATLGPNCYQGITRDYTSYDYTRLDYDRLFDPQDWVYRWFIARPAIDAEQPEVVPNVVDASALRVSRALRLAREHPFWFVRGRVKRLANWAAPISFYVRHYALGRYHGVLNDLVLRRLLISLCVLQTTLVIGLSWPGFVLSLRTPAARMMLGGMLLYFLTTAMLAGMSRHRMAVEPVLLILAAGFLSGAGRPWRGRGNALAAVVVGWALLGLLWYLNHAEVAGLLRRAW